jgi:hypothetical protein
MEVEIWIPKKTKMPDAPLPGVLQYAKGFRVTHNCGHATWFPLFTTRRQLRLLTKGDCAACLLERQN